MEFGRAGWQVGIRAITPLCMLDCLVICSCKLVPGHDAWCDLQDGERSVKTKERRGMEVETRFRIALNR